MRDKATEIYTGFQARLIAGRNERGDLVGWLLIAVMTAALIAVVWGTLGGQLKGMINGAIEEARGTADNL